MNHSLERLYNAHSVQPSMGKKMKPKYQSVCECKSHECVAVFAVPYLPVADINGFDLGHQGSISIQIMNKLIVNW